MPIVFKGIDDLLGLSGDTSNNVQMPVDMAGFMSNEMGTVPGGMGASMTGTVGNGTGGMLIDLIHLYNLMYMTICTLCFFFFFSSPLVIDH